MEPTEFLYIRAPAVSMKKLPLESSEVVSQAYFSEEVFLLDNQEDWAYIQTAVDGYGGWVPKKSLCLRKEPFAKGSKKQIAKVKQCSAHVYREKDTIFGPLITLPFESKLEVATPSENLQDRWVEVLLVDGQTSYIQRGDLSFDLSLKNLEEIESFCLRFLNLPYTWGGRCSFGYDCSGFVQMLYRQMGLFLPRDAKDQIHWKGFRPSSLEEVKLGDLLFWGPSQEKVFHVGMCLDNLRFIHATVAQNAPYLRISSLEEPYWNGSGTWPFVAARTPKSKPIS